MGIAAFVFSLALGITHYDLNYSFDFNEKKLFCTATLSVDRPDTLNLLLYRLLKVKSVKNENGQPVHFTQNVRAFDDWEQLQVNALQIIPTTPSKKFTIEYDGYLNGYTETGMMYVKDHIDPNFTILRMDCFAYPVEGITNWEKNNNITLPDFGYKISVTVPDSLTVVNGGALHSKKTENGLTTYTFTNRKPAWRIDIAIGKYKTYTDNDFVIHYFPEDSSRIKTVGDRLKQAYSLYGQWFGKKNDDRYTVIEIPTGWGSQTDVTSILQEASAIKDDKHMYELYHEISHIWNLKPVDPSPSRLESEGLAVFLQYLLMEKLHGNEGMLDASAERIEQRLKKQLEKNPKAATIPIAGFGPNQLTDLSYTKGMLFFYALYKKVGEEKFMKAIRDYYSKYRATGATLQQFSESLSASLPGTKELINDWLYAKKASR